MNFWFFNHISPHIIFMGACLVNYNYATRRLLHKASFVKSFITWPLFCKNYKDFSEKWKKIVHSPFSFQNFCLLAKTLLLTAPISHMLTLAPPVFLWKWQVMQNPGLAWPDNITKSLYPVLAFRSLVQLCHLCEVDI